MSFFSRKNRSSLSDDLHSAIDTQLVRSVAGSRRPTFKQLKHLPRFLSTRQRGLVKACLAILLVSSIAVGAKFGSEHIRRVATQGGSYVEAVTKSEIRYINPILSASNDADSDLIKLVFAGLMRVDTNGSIVPDMAESFEVSKDEKTYTFKLRQNLAWHDGTLFTANDVVFTLNAIANPAWKSPLNAKFRGITVSSPDEHTVVVTVSEPSAAVLPAMTVGILPEHLWQEIVPENALRAELNIKPVGTGPFKFKSLTKNTKGAIRSITLTRFDAYHLGAPHLDTISFDYFGDDVDGAVEALLKRKVSGINLLPSDAEEKVLESSSLKVTRLHLPQYNAVFFNQSRQPALASLPVRKALLQAIDREHILSTVLTDKGLPAYGPALPGLIGFTPDVLKYSYDAVTAAQALEADGWKLGEDGKRTKTTGTGTNKKTSTLAFTLTTVDTKELTLVAEAIVADWQKIGVQAELLVVPRTEIQKDILRTRDYDALLYGELIAADSDFFPFWHSSQAEGTGLNLALWKNSQADKLLEQARTVSVAEREKLYQQFQEILLKDLPALFIYSPTYPYALTRNLKGVDGHFMYVPADRFTDVHKWYVETTLGWE